MKRATAILKLLMAKLLTQDWTCFPSALLREKHLEWSVTTMLDRLTNSNLGEGVVDFKMYNYQVERLVNNLVATKAVVGSVILVNPIRVKVVGAVGNIPEGEEDIEEDSKISARESMEGREDD